ncbi:MAG: putative transposase for insertion sequence element [Phycisphaerales bacterium]|nr:putative transposase for insertion sequence element [Phycisphaerales bacterium]
MSGTFLDARRSFWHDAAMGRPLRNAAGGVIYHALNRANGRLRIFDNDGDYAAFETVLAAAVERSGVRLLAWCLMPNHWHLLAWPHRDGQLSDFMRWLTLTHTQRWHAHRHDAGSGHVYQGRFKSFPVQEDRHFLIVARYIERNALRAGLVKRAEHWRWSSLWAWTRGSAGERALLSPWPVRRSPDWLNWVNQPQTPAEEQAIQTSIKRGRPFGEDAWQRRTADELGLGTTLAPRGRPPIPPKPEISTVNVF